MQFPQQDLTYQYISTSYQSVVQTFTTGSNSYLLDGYGYVIADIPSASIGQIIVTQDQTASYASISNLSLVSDVALISETSSVSISSSYAIESDTSSISISASYALSASWAPISVHVEKGIISGSNFTGTPLIYNIIYANAYPNNIYTIGIIGEDARIWTANNRTTTGFTISSNSNQSILGMVMWRVEQI